jgi:hypothetical protein
MAQMHEGIAAFHAVGVRTLLPGALGSLAVAQAKAGQPQEGLATLDEALVALARTGTLTISAFLVATGVIAGLKLLLTAVLALIFDLEIMP